MFRTERVNGFLDAVRHVWRAEGSRGLWKGVGTSLYVLLLIYLTSFNTFFFSGSSVYLLQPLTF
jgi:hypothetical protein